jgi:Skp family chaperone for outer membrane proteins
VSTSLRTVAALALITVAPLGCATTTQGPAAPQVAVVDMDRAVRECREGRAASEELKRYSTVTDFARLRGWSTSLPLASAIA